MELKPLSRFPKKDIVCEVNPTPIANIGRAKRLVWGYFRKKYSEALGRERYPPINDDLITN